MPQPGRVHLVQLADPTRGGWPAYTAHLAHGLAAAGHQPHIWRLSTRHEARPRPFRQGLTYCNGSAAALEELARRERVHITAAATRQADTVARLLAAGATITVHDPTELDPAMLAALATARDVVTVRQAVLAHLHPAVPRARWVRHPYQQAPPAPQGGPPRRAWAVAYSRIDWDKGTHHIVAANRQLPATRQVTMFGALNRIYAHHKLRDIDPSWDRNYHGPWPVGDLWGGVGLARQARWAVDMSTIKGDGGGTQYTFLEALDAGAALLLHTGWRIPDQPGDLDQVATYVSPERLADALAAPPQPPPAAAVRQLLAQHDAAARATETIA